MTKKQKTQRLLDAAKDARNYLGGRMVKTQSAYNKLDLAIKEYEGD